MSSFKPIPNPAPPVTPPGESRADCDLASWTDNSAVPNQLTQSALKVLASVRIRWRGGVLRRNRPFPLLWAIRRHATDHLTDAGGARGRQSLPRGTPAGVH